MRNPYLRLVRPFTLISAFVGGVVLYFAFAQTIDFRLLLLATIFSLLQAGGQSYNQAVKEEVDIDFINGKRRPTVTGEISLREARMFGAFLLLTAIFISGYVQDIVFSLLVVAGAFLAWQYTDYPIRAKRFFLINNLWQATARGFLPIVTAYYLATGGISLEVIVIAVIVLIWVFIFQTTKDFGDVAGDRQYGIKTIPVTWGNEGAKRFMMVSYGVLVVLVALLVRYEYLSVWYFVPLIPSLAIFPSLNKKTGENNMGWKLYYATLGLWFVMILVAEVVGNVG